jgi:glutathione synthase/RimK-type ligase-like ATP-grasp enzyme
MNIAIIFNSKAPIHSGSWSIPWQQYCKENGLNFEMVDETEANLLERLFNFNLVLWHFSGFNYAHMMFARSILLSLKSRGIQVFPGFDEAWHFDDKIAESFLLQSINASIPEYFFFMEKDNAVNWAKGFSNYPIVAKLKCGSGSHNVKIINHKSEAVQYIEKMFADGFESSPSVLFKGKSNVSSSKSFHVLYKRVKRIPEFLRNYKKSKLFPNEKNYVYFQEFVPNDGYDLKVVVVGDKLSFIARNVRKNDFRASGGGSLYYDKSLITKELIDSAFEVSDKLNFKCMGYDYVIDNVTKKCKIVEISYGFSSQALMGAGGYFDRQGNWHNEELNAPKEVIESFIKGN